MVGARCRPRGHIAAWPTPTALRKAGKERINAKPKNHGCRRHTIWASQIVSALDQQTVVIAGTDAGATLLPHPATQLIALHSQRADVAAQVEPLVQALSLQGPDLHVRDRGPGRLRFPGRALGKTFDTEAQIAFYAGLVWATRDRAHRSVLSMSPTPATSASSAPCSCSPFAALRRPCLQRPPSAQTRSRETPQPGRPRPGPPPHPDPVHHDPRQHPATLPAAPLDTQHRSIPRGEDIR